MARPFIKLDEALIEKLASIHCTMEEIASVCNCSVDTLERRCAELIKKAKDKGKSSLRRLQWENAQKGNVTMQIWLGKQLLAQTDKVEQRTTLSATANVKVEESKALVEEFKSLLSNSANERAVQ